MPDAVIGENALSKKQLFLHLLTFQMEHVIIRRGFMMILSLVTEELIENF